jgi:putative ABC transport system permease protein
MHDWRRLVRERLTPLALPGPREEEIREELAQQLEQGYEEALAAGAGETEAAARALAQMGDWALLAAEIADAELGAVEPVVDRPAAGEPAVGELPDWPLDIDDGGGGDGDGGSASDDRRRAGRGRQPLRNFPPPARLRPIAPYAAPGHTRRRAGPARVLARAMGDLSHDVRLGLRACAAHPAVTALAVLMLALGIGANAAIFSLVDGILFRPLPYADPDRLVSAWQVGAPKGAFSALRTASRSLDIEAYAGDFGYTLTGRDGDPVRLDGSPVSVSLFSMLGVKPRLGRLFRPDENAPVSGRLVILSDALWRQRFGADPGVVGRPIVLDGEARQVVAVMPPEFRFPSPGTQLWVPIVLDATRPETLWGDFYYEMIARLRPGATLAQARAEMRQFVPRVVKAFPWPMPPHWGEWNEVLPWQQHLVGDVQAKLLILFGAVALLLLIACANVANLLLARAASRQTEIAVRGALGAGRARIVRQLLAESLPLVAAGGALGLWLGARALQVFKWMLPPETPRLAEVTIDARVLGFCAALALSTGLLFALVPALRAARPDLDRALRSNSRRAGVANPRRRLSSVLVVGETALAVVLVIGAGLLWRSLWELSRLSTGFRPDGVLTARLRPSPELCAEPERCLDFYRRLLERARQLPGVREAALGDSVPLGGVGPTALAAEGSPQYTTASPYHSWEFSVTPGYLRTMGIPLLAGRDFDDRDRASSRGVVIVSPALARALWPGRDPLGKRLRPAMGGGWRTVVGVAGDVREHALSPGAWADHTAGDVYFPASQGKVRAPSDMTLVLRVGRGPRARDPRALVHDLRAMVASTPPGALVSEVRTMPEVLSLALAAPRSTAALFVLFSLLALLLGAVGLYGVISYGVAERTHEIGVRIALGARAGQVVGLIVSQGMLLAGAGLVLGTAMAAALGRLMTSQLHGIPPLDPPTYLAVATLLSAVAFAASYLPARRATRVDPQTALRSE